MRIELSGNEYTTLQGVQELRLFITNWAGSNSLAFIHGDILYVIRPDGIGVTKVVRNLICNPELKEAIMVEVEHMQVKRL
jgi:hypothetical protein